MSDVADRIRQWRMKAEELRTTADHIENPFAQASFRRMAETYERLAEDFSRRFSDEDDGVRSTKTE
jgi:hypothetical protein